MKLAFLCAKFLVIYGSKFEFVLELALLSTIVCVCAAKVVRSLAVATRSASLCVSLIAQIERFLNCQSEVLCARAPRAAGSAKHKDTTKLARAVATCSLTHAEN